MSGATRPDGDAAVRGSSRQRAEGFEGVPTRPTVLLVDDVPYMLAIIELEEGWRMNSNIINVDANDVKVGMPVEVVWDDVTPEITLPTFQIVS